jgi:hypothetical protein
MRNIPNRIAIKPRSTVFDNRTDMIWVPCIGGQAGSINLAGTAPIVKGYPTKIILGSSNTALAGQYCYVSSVGGMTELNGFHKILGTDSTGLWLDVDSGNFSNWTSGGTVKFDVFFDRCGNLPPQIIQGTTTNAWGTKAWGLTTHSSGNNSLHIPRTALPDFLDMTGGHMLVCGASIKIATAPSTYEQVFSLGSKSTSGTAGHIGLTIVAGGTQIEATSRPAGTGKSNTNSYSSTLGTSLQRRIALLVDYHEMVQYCYLDGRLRDVDAITDAGQLNAAQGLYLGADMNTALDAINKLGGASTPSQAIVRDIFFWRPADGMTAADAHAAIVAYHKTGEWPAGY